MKLTLGFSPCPNDTFIFDALANKKIDTEGLDFEIVLEDVETLNRWTLEGKLDITKLSFPAFFRALDKYVLLNSGSALGKGVGPLLISREPASDSSLTDDKSIAIPGLNTTANLLLSFAYPQLQNKSAMLFSAIEDAVLNQQTEWGVIIHENRFTYQQRGLHKIADLGEYWENKTGVPIPLGGIAIKRSMDTGISTTVDRLIRNSLEYAFTHYPQITDYVKAHSQNMDESVMRQHIDLYVNNYSIELGADGRAAIEKLLAVFSTINKVEPPPASTLFL